MHGESERQFLAHPRHGLVEHLQSVAEKAAGFAGAFESAEWGRLAGLWHDLGKFQEKFQRKLRGESLSVEHSGAGAAYAMAVEPSNRALPLAFVIAGHHAGLANLQCNKTGAPKALKERLDENRQVAEAVGRRLPGEIARAKIPPLPEFLAKAAGTVEEQRRRIEFWIRFLFSALTDADYLDTEAALDPQRAAMRAPTQRLDELIGRLEEDLRRRGQAAPSVVNEARGAVSEACLRAAAQAPGLFSLTAPTGAGKTLAAMRFALHHAEAHGLRRVIAVLPYTSIIEQNAAVYREVFGEAAVLEHHSSLDPEKERERSGEEVSAQHRLASENWGAPLVVTTTVQFFESLFANRSSRCRKLHNIARSVVILDEVQSLPPGLLIPVVDALKTLSSDYGCTIVLSTATPPALVRRRGAEWGLPEVREIIPGSSALFRSLRRVRYEWPGEDKAVEWEDLAGRIGQHRQALAVVHLRGDARRLATILREECAGGQVHHLSAAMCPAHRSDVLAQVRAALAAGRACHLVSTQLIEAGVDIDFPVVFRAMAGLDSIVQAAGRCNREGRLAQGVVQVFHAPTQPPPGVLRQGIEAMKVLCGSHGAGLDLSDPGICLDYFRLLYSVAARDAPGIQALRTEFNFAAVAATFKMIEDQATAAIVVPYAGAAASQIESIRRHGPSRERYRALQPYTVRVYPNAFGTLRAMGAVEELQPGLNCLLPQYGHLYDDAFGLRTDDSTLALLVT
jgi:CRISPR-associated endonuclease/helicase Cas3